MPGLGDDANLLGRDNVCLDGSNMKVVDCVTVDSVADVVGLLVKSLIELVAQQLLVKLPTPDPYTQLAMLTLIARRLIQVLSNSHLPIL